MNAQADVRVRRLAYDGGSIISRIGLYIRVIANVWSEEEIKDRGVKLHWKLALFTFELH